MESLWLPAQRAHIRYRDFDGAEPALVLLHGLGSASSLDFPRIARQPALSAFRFILPDFLGFGSSDRPADFDYSLESHAETVYELLEHLGLSQVCLFGHSMGGAVAVALTAAHPDLVDRLVLAEANLDPGVGQASKRIAAQTEERYVREGHERFVTVIQRSIETAGTPTSYGDALAMADPVAMHRSSVGLIRGTVPAQRDLFLSWTMPRAFIFGERSLPDPDVENLRAGGIDVRIVPGAGHDMMHENPEGFGRVLLEAFGL